MAFTSTDWAIDYVNKTVTNDDSGTGDWLPAAFGDNTHVGPILELFQWLAAEFAATAQMDDEYGIESQTPTVFKWLQGWTFGHADDFKYLEGGSIEDPVGSGTATADSFWSNVYSIGSQTEGTQIYMIQNDVEVTPWWITGNIDILVLVKDTGSWIQSNDTTGSATDGGTWLYAREFGDEYDHNFGDISGGRSPIGINTAKDGNNDSGELYLSVASATGFVAGNFVASVSGAVGKIEKIVADDIYLNAVRGGAFGISEALTEDSDRELQTATGESTTNDAATAFTNVVAGYTLTDPAFADISRDLNNGDGLQPYKVDVDGNGATMKQHYEWLKWVCRYASTTTLNGDDGQEYRSALEGTYADVKKAPFGTLAGTTFYGARGVWLSDYASADFVLIDADGDQQSPPNYQKVIASHTNLSTTNVFVAEITGDGGTIIKDQYTYDDGSSDATHLHINEASIDINKTPQTGIVRVGDNQYVYTSFTGKIFTVTSDPTGETNGADTYVPLLDVLADASSEQSDNIIYSGTPFWCRTVTRKYGYKPYSQDAQFASNGLPFTPILADDPQAT